MNDVVSAYIWFFKTKVRWKLGYDQIITNQSIQHHFRSDDNVWIGNSITIMIKIIMV